MPTQSLAHQVPQVSPLVLVDRLLSLAQDADKAGFQKPARRLLQLAFAVCDERPVSS